MKFNFLKFKKQGLPSLKSLRPQIFDVNLFWFMALGLSLVIFIITGFIGFRLFYSQYSESYKKSGSTENIERTMNINKLKDVILKRNELINQEITLPRDPSM